VQIFENRGAMMGASNPHPHGQIWSTGFVPDEPAAETLAQREHLARTGHCLLCDYLRRTDARSALSSRMSTSWRWFPWWAVWPFEVLLVSPPPPGALPELSADERDGLADALKRLTTRFDNLFETSFPYTMGFHQSPTDGDDIRSGISTPTSIRRCCAPPRCASSWWVLRCWACRSGTSRPRRRGPAAARRPAKSISGREAEAGLKVFLAPG
jgi:galactose-1-phosphate uridylyltransferase